MRKFRLCFVLILTLLVLSLTAAAGGIEAEGTDLTNAEGYVYSLDDGCATIVGYTGADKKLTIPSALDGHAVVSIGKRAFYQNSVTEVTLPNGLNTISTYAFQGCKALKKVTLPDTVQSIESGAFASCMALKDINIPDSVLNFGSSVFYQCNKLIKPTLSKDHPVLKLQDGVLFSKDGETLLWYPITKTKNEYSVPEGTSVIDRSAFACATVKKVVFPMSVKTIRKGSFSGCPYLSEVNIPQMVTELENVFNHCTKLCRVDVDDGNTEFYSEDGILFDKNEHALILYPAGRDEKQYSVPEGIEIIGASAFCDALLEEISIPSSVRIIGAQAFQSCRNLKKIELPEGVLELGGGAFVYCSSLTEVFLPGSIKKVGNHPFRGCGSLNSVYIAEEHPYLVFINESLVAKDEMRLIWYSDPDLSTNYHVPNAIRIIGPYAFDWASNLIELTIPEGVEEIQDHAFSNCKELQKITLPSSITFIDKTAFIDKNGMMMDIIYDVVKGSYADNYCKAYGLRTENH